MDHANPFETALQLACINTVLLFFNQLLRDFSRVAKSEADAF